MMSEEDLQRLLDRAAISDVVHAYATGLDRRDWPLFPSIFTGATAETFPSRIGAWIDDLRKKTPPEEIDGKGEDALKVQLIIEAAIKSWDKGKVISV